MSLLLDALKRAEEAKRARELTGQAGGDEAAPIASRPAVDQLSLQEYETEPAISETAPPPKKQLLDFARDPVPAKSPQADANAVAGRLVRQDFSLRPDNSAAETAQREAARNVFSAKLEPQQDDAPTRGRLLLPLLAFLIVGLGGAGWYVWNEVTKFSRGASTAIAQRPAPPAPLPPAAPAIGQVAPASVAESAAAQPLPPLLPPPAREAPLPKATTGAAERSAHAPGRREQLANDLRGGSRRAPKDAPVSLKLSQSITPPRINPDVQVAYGALARGDLVQAKQRYERAVQSEPLNIDAQLGLATTAARRGENAEAALHYRKVLELDPRNGTAMAGLLSIGGGANSQATETELRNLIAKSPDAAALHFSLGNLYAGERRWREAQQAYFEAYRIESGNADYLYNLAVALDHLQQPKLALDYYRKALDQAGKTGAQFDSAPVQRRAAELGVP